MNDFVGTAVALHPEASAAQYKEVKAFRARMAEIRRGYSTTGWWASGFMGLVATALGAGWLMYPIKEIKVVYLDHDTTTGWIGPAAEAHDAPRTWGDKEARAALSEYVYARERYVPAIDNMNWDKVKAMTSVAEWRNYTDWVDSKTSPKNVLKKKGHVDVWDFSFINPNRSPDGTTTYQVLYKRRTVDDLAAGTPRIYTCNTQISFRLHPSAKQTEQEAMMNPWGLQVLAYKEPEPAEGCR